MSEKPEFFHRQKRWLARKLAVGFCYTLLQPTMFVCGLWDNRAAFTHDLVLWWYSVKRHWIGDSWRAAKEVRTIMVQALKDGML